MGIQFPSAGTGEVIFGFALYAAQNYADFKNVKKAAN